jgi:hypothetical protein
MCIAHMAVFSKCVVKTASLAYKLQIHRRAVQVGHVERNNYFDVSEQNDRLGGRGASLRLLRTSNNGWKSAGGRGGIHLKGE